MFFFIFSIVAPAMFSAPGLLAKAEEAAAEAISKAKEKQQDEGEQRRTTGRKTQAVMWTYQRKGRIPWGEGKTKKTPFGRY